VGDNWHKGSTGGVSARLIEPSVELTSLNPFAFDMKARNADNVRAISTAVKLLPPPRLSKAMPPQELS
jgi:hypothetical protein